MVTNSHRYGLSLFVKTHRRNASPTPGSPLERRFCIYSPIILHISSRTNFTLPLIICPSRSLQVITLIASFLATGCLFRPTVGDHSDIRINHRRHSPLSFLRFISAVVFATNSPVSSPKKSCGQFLMLPYSSMSSSSMADVPSLIMQK